MNDITIQLAIASIAIILFRYQNSEKALLNTTSILVLLIFVMRSVVPQFGLGIRLPIILSICFVIVYSIRLVRRESLLFFDSFKLLGAILLSLYPFNFFPHHGCLGQTLFILEQVTLPILASIYVYDRLILKTEMKRKFIIILGIQTFLIIVFLMYAVIQKIEADTQTELAKRNERLVKETVGQYETKLLDLKKEVDSLTLSQSR